MRVCAVGHRISACFGIYTILVDLLLAFPTVNVHAIVTKVHVVCLEPKNMSKTMYFVNEKSQLNIYNDKEMTCDRIEFVIVQGKMTMVERMNTGLKFSISRVLASFI